MKRVLVLVFSILIVLSAFISCNPDEWPETDGSKADTDVNYTIKGQAELNVSGSGSFKSGDTFSIFDLPDALKEKKAKNFSITLKKEGDGNTWTIDGSFTVPFGTSTSDVKNLEWGGGLLKAS